MPKKTREEIDETGVLAERTTSDGRRRLQLTAIERNELLHRERIEAAAFLFLNIRERKTYQEIADELGISTHQLKELTKTPEFDAAYNALFAEVGHDPRYRAAQAQLVDLLPLAMQTYEEILTDHNAAAGVRKQTADKIVDLVGLTVPQAGESSLGELMKLLAGEVNIENLNIVLPGEYLRALQTFEVHPIEGSARDLPDEPPELQD